MWKLGKWRAMQLFVILYAGMTLVRDIAAKKGWKQFGGVVFCV